MNFTEAVWCNRTLSRLRRLCPLLIHANFLDRYEFCSQSINLDQVKYMLDKGISRSEFLRAARSPFVDLAALTFAGTQRQRSLSLLREADAILGTPLAEARACLVRVTDALSAQELRDVERRNPRWRSVVRAALAQELDLSKLIGAVDAALEADTTTCARDIVHMTQIIMDPSLEPRRSMLGFHVFGGGDEAAKFRYLLADRGYVREAVASLRPGGGKLALHSWRPSHEPLALELEVRLLRPCGLRELQELDHVNDQQPRGVV